MPKGGLTGYVRLQQPEQADPIQEEVVRTIRGLRDAAVTKTTVRSLKEALEDAPRSEGIPAANTVEQVVEASRVAGDLMRGAAEVMRDQAQMAREEAVEARGAQGASYEAGHNASSELWGKLFDFQREAGAERREFADRMQAESLERIQQAFDQRFTTHEAQTNRLVEELAKDRDYWKARAEAAAHAPPSLEARIGGALLTPLIQKIEEDPLKVLAPPSESGIDADQLLKVGWANLQLQRAQQQLDNEANEPEHRKEIVNMVVGGLQKALENVPALLGGRVPGPRNGMAEGPPPTPSTSVPPSAPAPAPAAPATDVRTGTTGRVINLEDWDE